MREALRPVLEDPAVPKVLHNAKFDIKVLARHGIRLRGLTHDTMLAAYLLSESQIGLKALASSRLGDRDDPDRGADRQGPQAEIDARSARRRSRPLRRLPTPT